MKFKSNKIILFTIFCICILLVGCFKSNNNECKHKYIDKIVEEDDFMFGIVDAVTYKTENDKTILLVTSIIDGTFCNGGVSAPVVEVMSNKDGYIEYFDTMSTGNLMFGYQFSVHQNTDTHVEVVYGIELPKRIEKSEYIILKLQHIVDYFQYNLQWDDIREVESLNSYNKERFEEAYKIISEKHNSNEEIKVELNEFYLEGQDFIINFDIVNKTDKKFTDLQLDVQAIQNTGYPHRPIDIDENEKSFDLNAYETRNFNYIINIHNSIIYNSDIYNRYSGKNLKNDENIILNIKFYHQNTDEDKILMKDKYVDFYIKDKVRVKSTNLISEDSSKILERMISMTFREVDKLLKRREYDEATKVLAYLTNLPEEKQEDVDEYYEKINKLLSDKDKPEAFDIFNPSRKLTIEEAKLVAKHCLGDSILNEDGTISTNKEIECYVTTCVIGESRINEVLVDLNTGKVDYGYGWAKYLGTMDDIEKGYNSGWLIEE